MAPDAFNSRKSLARKEVSTAVGERYSHELTIECVEISMAPYLDQLQACHSLPQEGMRMLMPLADLENHIRALHMHAAAKFSELVFNLDELRFAD
jgi:hypothetical protein